MHIRNFIFAASILVSALFFGGTYWTMERVFADLARASAERTSAAAARITFSAMYELMSQGWSRRQADGFVAGTAAAGGDTGLSVQIYRSPVVVDRYRPIDQPPADVDLLRVFADGQVLKRDSGDRMRHIFPLVAEQRCLGCHDNARVGTVLGAVEVRQDYADLLAAARREFFWPFALLLPLVAGVAALLVWRVGRRIERGVAGLQAGFDKVGSVQDLRHVAVAGHDLGFVELNRLRDALGGLVGRLREIAIDKETLVFENGLLEHFVIASDVVQDWREHVGKLLADLNVRLPAPMLFALFCNDDDAFDLEVFWNAPVTEGTRSGAEHAIREMLIAQRHLPDGGGCNIRHYVANPDGQSIDLPVDELAASLQSFFGERPRIGGIVGIGLHAGGAADERRHLVVDSVLSTLLNVVGSLRAICRYTCDLRHYATRDSLTDLFNQRMFWELAANLVSRSQRDGNHFGLLLIDLDNFKLINDNHGHAVGDAYLQRFAKQVHAMLREGDVLARYGGDEFVVLLPDAGQEAVVRAAGRILKAVDALVVDTPEGIRVHGTASVGLAIFPEHADNARDLLMFADQMMYRAKTAGKAQVAAPSAGDAVDVFRNITQKSAMVLDAIEQRRVLPYFQPLLDIASRRIVAYEVLSRIQLADRLVAADEFVEIAERIGVIHRLDMIVLEQALAVVAQGGHEGEVFVNLSPRALVSGGYARDLRRIVAASGISPASIVFEITERDTVKNLVQLESFLSELKADGFKLAIDDFGSGFSSFHYLRRFPIDYLKIEGDFIAKMMSSDKDHAFVTSIRSLAREMGITVVAEYVESAEVLGELARLEVQLAQGYYVGRPARGLVLAA